MAYNDNRSSVIPANEYRTSWGIVIGITQYQNLPPMLDAADSAQKCANLLTHYFDFPPAQFTLLLDDAATKEIFYRPLPH